MERSARSFRGRKRSHANGAGVRRSRGKNEMRIYLAGPDVFLPNAKEIGGIKKEMCREFGFEGLFPLDNDFPGEPSALEIYRANLMTKMQAASLSDLVRMAMIARVIGPAAESESGVSSG